MPVLSPFQRATQEGLNQPDGSSDGGKRKRGHSTSRRRNMRQKIKEKYAKLREEAQLAGVIPTVPEGAVRPEQVPPSVQGDQPLPELIAQAIRRGWAVEDGMKPHLVDELVQIVMTADMPTKAKIAAFNALRMADQSQWERDHPGDKKETPPFQLNVNVVAVDQAQPTNSNGVVNGLNLIEVMPVGRGG